MATGLQDKFDWAGVAAAAAVPGVTDAISRGVGLGPGTRPVTIEQHSQRFAASLSGAVAGAGTRTILSGGSFGDNLIPALPDVIGNTIGNVVAGAVQAAAAERQAESLFKEIVSSAEGQVVLAGIGKDPNEVTTKELLNHLQPALLSGKATKEDLAQAKANIEQLVSKWGAVAERNGGDRTAVNLAKNDALRLVYAAMFIEMPRFQWTGVGMTVGGETVRAKIVRLGGMIRDARAAEQGAEGSLVPISAIAGPLADQIQYLQDKIVEGQIGVVTDIGKLALVLSV